MQYRNAYWVMLRECEPVSAVYLVMAAISKNEGLTKAQLHLDTIHSLSLDYLR